MSEQQQQAVYDPYMATAVLDRVEILAGASSRLCP